MRLLVFGETGQLARELAALAGPDLQVTCLGRARADLADPGACAAALAGAEADAVINAAAWTAVDRAEAEEAAAHVVNAQAPGAMARAAAARGLPFLHVSTDYVFDGTPGRPWTEEDTPAPLSAYGRGKLAGERLVAEAGGTWAVLRTSWVFSAHGGNFVKTMLRLGASRAEVSVVADQFGGPTPAAAIAAALVTMARAMAAGTPGGVFHFAGSPDTSWAGFAGAIFAAAGMGVRVTPIPGSAWPAPAPRPLNSTLDCRRIADRFGIIRPDWRAGLAEVLAQIQANPPA